MYEFYIGIQKQLEQIDISDELKSIYKDLTDRLIHFSDGMAPIETLSTYPATSEITILLMDLHELGSYQDPDELLPSLDEKIESFLELMSLLVDEDGFLNSIRNYIAENDVHEHLNEEKTSETSPTQTDVIEESTEHVVEQTEEDERLSFSEAIVSEVLSRLSSLNDKQKAFAETLFTQLDKKDAILESLLPSEVSNSVLIANELIESAGKKLYANCELLEQNILAIEHSFFSELEDNQFDILATVEQDSKQSAEAIPQIKKPSKKTTSSSDVKEKVRKYFQNEVYALLEDVTKVVSTVEIHEIIHEQFVKLHTIFTELKNISIIHGYEGIQTISSEFASFLNECTEGDFVFTEESQSCLQQCMETFRSIVEFADRPEEKVYVNTFFKELNAFNETLAILEIVEEECYEFNVPEVRNSFFKVIQNKYGEIETVSHIDLEKAKQDYALYGFDKNVELYSLLLSKSEGLLDEIKESIIDTFLYEISDDDIRSIEDEISTLTQKKLQSHSLEEKNAHIQEQKYSFSEIQERNGIFESVLIKKVKKLSDSFENFEAKSVVHLSNWIELETRLMGYDQVADLFNYFLLNIDNMRPKQAEVIQQFTLVQNSPIDYVFSVEIFEGHEEKSEPEPQIKHKDDATSIDEIDESIREVFSEEAQSYVAELEDQLRVLKSSPDNSEALFKGENAAHTLRGAAKILKLDQIASLSGHIEFIFEKSQDGITTNQIIEIENRLDTVKKLVGIYQPSDNDDDGDVLQSGQDEEMMEIFREESEAELKRIEELFDQLVVAKDQSSLLTTIESNAHTLKSSAKILGFKEIGLLSEKIEEAGEKLKNMNVHIGITVIDEMRNVLAIIKKLRNGIVIGINDIQNSTRRLADAISGQLPTNKRMGERKLGEFEQLFIDETLDKVIRILEKIEHSDPLQDLSVEFNNIKRSAALVGFNRIKNLATVTEKLCDIGTNKEDVYELSQEVTTEIKNACERILSGNYENIGQIDDLISKVNSAINAVEHHTHIDITKEVEHLRDLIQQTAEKLENRAAFMKKINRLRKTLANEPSLKDAVDDLLFITDRLSKEIEQNFDHIHLVLPNVKRKYFQFGDPGEVAVFHVKNEQFAIDHSQIKQLLSLDTELNDTGMMVVEENELPYESIHSLIGVGEQPHHTDSSYGVLLDSEKLIVSTETPFEINEAQMTHVGQLKLVTQVALTQDNKIHFVLNPNN